MYWWVRFKREDKDQDIREAILDIRSKYKNYGYRQTHADLRKIGLKINKKKTQKTCQELGIQVKPYGYKYRRYSSYMGIVGKMDKPFNPVSQKFYLTLEDQDRYNVNTFEFKCYKEDEAGNLQIKKVYRDSYLDLYNLGVVSF